MGIVHIQTPTCTVCGKSGIVDVDEAAFRRWTRAGADDPNRFVQNAFPTLTPGTREQLISGTHDECWEALFPPVGCSWEASGDPGDPACEEPVDGEGDLCAKHQAAYEALMAAGSGTDD